MTPSRRGFLKGLLSVPVISVAAPALAKVAGANAATTAPDALDWMAITPPPGLTYQWVRTSVMGMPDPANVQARLDNGWIFVGPDTHKGAPTSTVGTAIETGGLILMAKATSEIKPAFTDKHGHVGPPPPPKQKETE